MTTVRFVKHMNSEYGYELLLACGSKKWSGFVHSYKVSERQIIAV